MPLLTSSRYKNLEIQIDESGREYFPLRKPLNIDDFNFQDFFNYTTLDDDNMPLIAYNHWGEGNTQYWWVIADLNKILDPYNMQTGINLVIPSLYDLTLILQQLNLI